jgi:uncharacterized membrane protein
MFEESYISADVLSPKKVRDTNNYQLTRLNYLEVMIITGDYTGNIIKIQTKKEVHQLNTYRIFWYTAEAFWSSISLPT